jgi:hypothetical protein
VRGIAALAAQHTDNTKDTPKNASNTNQTHFFHPIEEQGTEKLSVLHGSYPTVRIEDYQTKPNILKTKEAYSDRRNRSLSQMLAGPMRAIAGQLTSSL